MNELFQLLTSKPDVANAIAAVASATVALIAFIVSVVSLYVTHATLKHQQRHNVLSVKPLPMVAVADYEDRLTVKIRNNGSGPLIVKAIHVGNGAHVEQTLIDWMPQLPGGMYWSTFVGSVIDRSITPGDEIILLELTGNHDDHAFVKARDSIRAALSPLTVIVEYTDVYDTIMKPHQKQLSWFARNLPDA